MSGLDQALHELTALYREVDAQAERLSRLHAARLRCRRGCHDCCVDGLTVFEVEAHHIRRTAGALLAAASAHPPGACSFLDREGSCRIYAQRPYVCRTQGLPLRWRETDDDGHTVELRDICPLNEAGPPVEGLAPEACWTIGSVEGRLASLQARLNEGVPARVALRALFAPG